MRTRSAVTPGSKGKCSTVNASGSPSLLSSSGLSRPCAALSAASSQALVNMKAAWASSRSGVSMPASIFASASMPNSRAAALTSTGACVRILRRAASSASPASCSNSISVPLITAPSRSGITRVAMRSHCRSPSEPRFSETRTGSPPRTRSRSRMDWPGTSPLTS